VHLHLVTGTTTALNLTWKVMTMTAAQAPQLLGKSTHHSNSGTILTITSNIFEQFPLQVFKILPKGITRLPGKVSERLCTLFLY
jgi:hypothetical protein